MGDNYRLNFSGYIGWINVLGFDLLKPFAAGGEDYRSYSALIVNGAIRSF